MIHGLKDVITKLPTANHATPIYLLKYLKKVTGYKDVNRIAVANMAIVFGPTLMWPSAHFTTTNMMQQNMIVEQWREHLWFPTLSTVVPVPVLVIRPYQPSQCCQCPCNLAHDGERGAA